ncbi:MAG: carboxypeptidase regulatory-like domain-containing protein, partial [Candidatus Cloacimonetes bacterium]|nr:carboxypeptidase regulatory-like domain-containing protein [Candidatus Cloacimonadota bacterium]
RSFSNVLEKIQETGMIAGVVRRLNTSPIQGATVTAGGLSATTNSVGAYTLVLPIGNYDVTCSATGYQSQTANDITVNPNQTTTLNFIMDVVSNQDEVVPVTATALLGNYPNPFNPETTIAWCLKEAAPVKIEIYNSKGQRIRTLLDETKAGGWYQTVWNGRDDNGDFVSSGVYMYRMSAGSYLASRKMMLMQ